MPANTSAASAICGIHFGLTKADTSITGRLAALNRLTNSILSAVEMAACSFCSPSRGPTSTTVMRLVMGGTSRQLDERGIRLNELALAAVDRDDSRIGGRAKRKLHLHRLEQNDRIALFHGRSRL